MKRKVPLVSVVMLNWNGKKWLKRCLPTLKNITYPNVEIIVVNNGSTDDSASFLKTFYPNVRVIELKDNIGYAGANNVGARNAKGSYLLFLNNDTEVTPGFLEPLVDALETDDTLGAVQPQMRSLIYPDRMDSVGSFMTMTGFLYHYGYMKPYKRLSYQKRMYMYSLKGSCFLMRKKDYRRLGGLDEDFVCYVEESDLCHRIWLSGKKVLYEPKSLMYHWGGGDMLIMTKNELTMFRSFRNRFYSYYKNFNMSTLLWLIPVHAIFAEFYVFASLISGKWKNAGGAQLGIWIGLLSFDKMRGKRNIIQSTIRTVQDSSILPYIMKNPRMTYYYYLFADIRKYEDE